MPAVGPDARPESREPVRVERVEGRRGLARFLAVPDAIYRDDPNWVKPLDFERREQLDQARNPFLARIEMALFVARRGSRDVGRISAQVNRAHLERYRDATGHFGFFETEDDPEVAAALVRAAEDWLRARGMRRIAGPFDPSINTSCGLLVEGFERPPSMMMGHHRPWYGARLEELGFRKEKDLLCYWYDPTEPLPPAALALLERARRSTRMTVRPLAMRRYAEEIRTICDIFNDAWSRNWGFVPFDEAEALYLARAIRPLVTARDFAIAEVEGTPAAMVVVLPNLNLAIRDLGGRLLPWGWAKLLWRLKLRGVPEWRIPLLGVRRAFQNGPLGAALAFAVLDAVRRWHADRGIRGVELSWILEDNQRIRAIIELSGARPYKTYRIYAKDIE
ncbi:MAG: dATP pyrophosphohydrolase [Geminicoccaceae bacterium]|nr:dATP pyrophosphohydrolase [Geminicoccaceae bacterium]